MSARNQRAKAKAGYPTSFLLIVAGAVVAFGVALYLALSHGQIPEDDLRPDDAELVALGQEVYARACAECHGANLEGQPNWQQRRADGRLPAPPQDETGHTWHHPGAQLFDFVKQGPVALVGGGYQSDMPGFADQLDDREIWAVLSYIKSTWPAEIRARHDQIDAQGGQH